jgi:type IV pilus assembly protein PilW
VVIFRGASDTGSDVLMVMSGATGYGEVLTNVPAGGVAATQVTLPNTIGYRAGDLVMLASGGECLLSQVDAAKPACAGDPAAAPGTACGPILPLGGAYYTPAGPNLSLATLALQSDVSAFSIGNATTNPPQFSLIGVGANSTLFTHNLLLLNGINNISEEMAEGVRELHAVYGLDTNDDGILDAWQSPTALWAGPALMDGSAASNARLRQIVAVRVGMVLRSSLVERELSPGVPVAPANLPLFSDLPAPNPIIVDLTRAGENRNQRHRTVEITVPLRNFLMRTTS